MVLPAAFRALYVGPLAVAMSLAACAPAPGPAAVTAREQFSRDAFCPLARVQATEILPMAQPPDKIARDPERLEMWLERVHTRTMGESEPKLRVQVRGCQEHAEYTCWERATLERARRGGYKRVLTMASCIPDIPPSLAGP
jgi:hypothetical protein